MYSIFTRKHEAAVFPTAQRYGLGVLTFSPLNGGWLSGHADPASGHRASRRPSVYDPSTPTGQLKAAALTKLTAVLIGPRTADQLDGLLSGIDIELPDDVLDRLDEIVPPGTDLDPRDNYAATLPAIEDTRLRRR